MESPQASGTGPPPVPAARAPAAARLSKLAVASLILSVLCIPVCYVILTLLSADPGRSYSVVDSLITPVPFITVLPLPAILGIAALNAIEAGKGRLKGAGLAVRAIILSLVQLLLVFLVGATTPSVLRVRKSANRAEAINNLKQVGMALASFEEEYGTFPSRQIYKDNRYQFENATDGDSANDLLGLLLAGGFTDSEEIFFARNSSTNSKIPDNWFKTPARLLEPGECGFGYVMLQSGRAMSTAPSNGDRPLLVAPLMPGSGGADPEFNPEPYEGYAIYLRIDQSVKQNRIDKAGKVVLPDKRTLFETGPDTAWGNDTPDVRPPE